MHWFDSLAKAAAGESVLDRRGLFKSAAVAGVLASPLMSDSVAGAATHLEARIAQDKCENCLKTELKDLKTALANCDKTGNIFGITPKAGSSKGKRPPAKAKPPPAKVPPIPAAKKIACVMQAQSIFANFTDKCIHEDCLVPQYQTQPPSSDAPPGSAPTCPPNTSPCSQSLCCYGGDACCNCGGTATCCAAVIGCTCC